MKFVEVPPGPPVISTITAEVYGPPDASYAEIVALARHFEARMAREPGIVDVDSSAEAEQTKWRFITDKPKAALSGVSTENIAKTLYGHKIDGIIAIGGEGTLAAADRLAKDGIKVLGVPKTIDNDLRATDYSFGFDTAVNIATDAMDRLRTTGDSHQRCMVAEVMGRHVGWIALHAGMAAGAHAILIPEVPQSLEQVAELVTRAHDRGRAPLVVVSEGFTLEGMTEAYSDKGLDAFNRPRLGGIGDQLAPEIERITGIETRATILGHIQRGGSPSAFDRVLATRLGLHAADAVVEGDWGQMVAMRGTDIVRVPFEEALGELNTVPRYRYDEAAALFG